LPEPIGLYIHVPFCRGKCPYCDFYSLPKYEDDLLDEYMRRLTNDLRRWAARLNCKADTVYFGGGTPSLLGGGRLSAILCAAREAFLADGADITVECNPEPSAAEFIRAAAGAGVNRISLGVQSAVKDERLALSRRGTPEDIRAAVSAAFNAGIKDVSADIMLGVPDQNGRSLQKTLDFCIDLGFTHVSAYMLKLEPGTLFYKNQSELGLPDEDEVCDMYLQACEFLEAKGLPQYEISNFARPGHESRHNLKYWNALPYLGLGPSAHSLIDGRRFFYPRDLSAFLSGEPPRNDGAGGCFEEYAMLRLRLSEGLTDGLCLERFGHGIPEKMLEKAAELEAQGLCETGGGSIRLTKNGFLLSNRVIVQLTMDS